MSEKERDVHERSGTEHAQMATQASCGVILKIQGADLVLQLFPLHRSRLRLLAVAIAGIKKGHALGREAIGGRVGHVCLADVRREASNPGLRSCRFGGNRYRLHEPTCQRGSEIKAGSKEAATIPPFIIINILGSGIRKNEGTEEGEKKKRVLRARGLDLRHGRHPCTLDDCVLSDRDALLSPGSLTGRRKQRLSNRVWE